MRKKQVTKEMVEELKSTALAAGNVSLADDCTAVLAKPLGTRGRPSFALQRVKAALEGQAKAED